MCKEETEEEDEKKAALKNFADKLVTETAKQIVHQFRAILDKNLQEKQHSWYQNNNRFYYNFLWKKISGTGLKIV